MNHVSSLISADRSLLRRRSRRVPRCHAMKDEPLALNLNCTCPVPPGLSDPRLRMQLNCELLSNLMWWILKCVWAGLGVCVTLPYISSNPHTLGRYVCVCVWWRLLIAEIIPWMLNRMCSTQSSRSHLPRGSDLLRYDSSPKEEHRLENNTLTMIKFTVFGAGLYSVHILLSLKRKTKESFFSLL